MENIELNDLEIAKENERNFRNKRTKLTTYAILISFANIALGILLGVITLFAAGTNTIANTIVLGITSLGLIFVLPIFQIIGLNKYQKNHKNSNVAFDLYNFFSFFSIKILAMSISVILGLGFLFLLGLKYEEVVRIGFLISSLAQLIFLWIAISLYYADEYKEDFKNFTKKIFENIFKVMGYLILALVVNAVFASIGTTLFPGGSGAVNQDEVQAILDSVTSNIGFILLIVVVGPLLEEFIFRFILMKKLLYKLPVILNVIISASIFAGMHAKAASGIIPFAHDFTMYIGMALTFCFVYAYEKNIFMTTSIHMLNNFIGLIAMLNI